MKIRSYGLLRFDAVRTNWTSAATTPKEPEARARRGLVPSNPSSQNPKPNERPTVAARAVPIPR